MQQLEIVKISDNQTKILRHILGERIYFFYSDKLQVEGENGHFLFWANGFAIALSTTNNGLENFRTYVNISADYRLSNRDAATYYEFDINVSSAPLWQEGSLQFGKLSSLRIFSDPILMIEVYQDFNEGNEKIAMHDCALVFYSQTRKILVRARPEVIGGVDVVLDEPYIETLTRNLKLRTTIV
ncbi:hypothetical protein ACMA1I_21140 [Pontibacter sp. 13R65]|uniref:hypothetical protein n=1 Tax=Pontibacter sp. 13R65 TaxID=3127458 RepID=UPI00301E01DE